jgi:hypothetical protein
MLFSFAANRTLLATVEYCIEENIGKYGAVLDQLR